MNSETRACKNTGKSKYCMGDFEITSDDFIFCEKINVPLPTLCPECRNQRRMLFRNFKTLYNRSSSKSGETIISMYNENVPFPVYEAREWWEDDWDAIEHGRDIDFSRPFFPQLKELFNVVPRMSLVNVKCVDCQYSNMAYGSNKCHLVFGCTDNDSCDYGHIVWTSKDSIDNLYIFKSEFCYECIDCLSCNGLLYSQECESCSDSVGLYNCKSCTNCIGCVGLKQKSYHIFNQPVSKEEYEIFKRKYPLSNKSSKKYILENVENLKKQNPEPELFGSRNVTVSGNHIYNSHNVFNSFDIKSGQDSKYGYTVRSFTDSYDVTFTPVIESSYEVLNCVGSHMLSTHTVTDSSFIHYSDSCFGCNNLFGCAGLRQKNYCILNKQYSKEEYEVLIPKVVELMKKYGEYGEFFPYTMSPFSYNESIANEYMPMTKEEALVLGFSWSDALPKTVNQGTVSFLEIPQNPEFYDDSLLKEVFTCTTCERNFRLIDREITFYKRFGILIPEQCFNCRHQERMGKRYPRKLSKSSCDFCTKNIYTSIPREKRDTVKIYCEDCYKKEVL